jgi:(p)ppGpp synthase/HD superfamily hydrolase
MVDVYSHGDATLWEPTSIPLPKEWTRQIKMLTHQERSPRYFYGLKNVRYDAQYVGNWLRLQGLPWHVAVAAYLWNCDQESIRDTRLQGADLVANHMMIANQYMNDIEERNVSDLLQPPYADPGALLIVMVAYYQAMQTLQKQSNGQPYTGDIQSFLEFIGCTLINIVTRLGMWSFKYPIENLIEQFRSPKDFAKASEEHARILAEDFIMMQSTRQLFLASYQDAMQRNATVVYKPCSVAGMKRRLQDAHTTATSQKSNLTGFDIVTYNIVVSTVQDCYNAFGILTQLGYIHDRVTDMIANPKPNGCSHLAFGLVLKSKGPRTRYLPWLEMKPCICQIQIMTQVMHAITWYGCLHPDYYRISARDTTAEMIEPLMGERLWTSQTGKVFSAIKESMILEKMQSRTENTVVVYDHKRTPVALPMGAKVLDFAYAFDSTAVEYTAEIFINSRKAALSRTLNAGDVIEIRLSNEIQAQEYWLYDDYTITQNARQKIKETLTRLSLERRGYSMLRQELERHHYMLIPEDLNRELEQLVVRHTLGTVRDYLMQIDEKRESSYTVAWAAQEIMQQITEVNEITSVSVGGSSWIPVLAIPITRTKKLYRKQRLCGNCQPTYPRDINIKGIIREKTRELVVHSDRCPLLVDDSAILSMTWENHHPVHRVTFHIKAHDRKGLLLDITKILHQHLCNFTAADAEALSEYGEAWIRCTIGTFTESEVLDIWNGLESVDNVTTVEIDAARTSTKTRDYIQKLHDEQHAAHSDSASLDHLWEEQSSPPPPRSIRLKNPFDISRPAEAKMFFGRSVETSMMNRELCEGESGRALILYGPYRSGKSSLCRNFLASHVRYPFLGVHVSLSSTTNYLEGDIFKEIANEINRRFHEQIKRPGPNWQDYYDGDPQIRFSTFLHDCIAQVEGTRIILALDEFGGALEAYQRQILDYRFFTYWKELIDKQPQLSLIFALPTSAHTAFTRTFSHVFSFADSLQVTFLDIDSAERLLVSPLQDLHIMIHPNTIARSVKMTGGHPFYMTLIGHRLINQLNKETDKQFVTDADFHFIIDQLFEEGSFQHFSFLADELQNRDEYNVLQALVDITSKHTHGPKARLKKVAAWLNLPEYVVRQHLDRLRVGLILEENGPSSNPYYSFRIELVRRWLIRNRSFFSTYTIG